MKNLKKLLVMALSMCMLLLVTVTPVYASNYVIKAGKEKTITQTIKNVTAYEGEVKILEDKDNIIDKIVVTVNADYSGAKVTNNSIVTFMTDTQKGYKISINIKVVLKSTAVAGQTAKVGLVDGYVSYFEGELDKPTSWSHTITVDEPDKPSVSKAKVSGIAAQKYTGAAIEPDFNVTLDGKTLVEGTDYKVSYKNNVNPGTATITITGMGNYAGTITKTFKIYDPNAPVEITEANISGIEDKYYTGKEITQKLSITFDGKTLVEGTDYTVDYKNNVEIGTATMTIKGIGKYTGTTTKTFKILEPEKISISDAQISQIEDQYYTGEEIKPSLTVTLGDQTLVEGTDYTVEYANNVEVGTGTVTITGIGAYMGTIDTTFNIVEKPCIIHYIIAAIGLVGAVIMFLLKKNEALKYAVVGLVTVVAVALALMVGHCSNDLIAVVVAENVLLLELLFLNKTKK